MSESLRDPIWQFVSVIIALTTLIVTVYLFLLGKRKKSLAHDFSEAISLLTVGEEIKGRVQIFFDGNLVDKVYLLTLRIYNNGSVPIKIEDYVEPLRVAFSDGTEIFSAEVIDTHPISLNPEFRIVENCVLFSPLLLNSSDAFTLKALVTNPTSQPFAYPLGRITGVSDIHPPTFVSVIKPVLLGLVFLAVGAVWGIIGLFTISPEPEIIEFSLKLAIPIFLQSFGFARLVVFFYQDIRRRRSYLQRHLGESFYSEFRRYFKNYL